tara:strand:+ start:5393 stop:6100 length:708 start_codon:yes stop_codon:yes gene_type:complete
MPDERVVTTFNPNSWDRFFKKNLLSWLKHLSCEIVVYYEGDQPPLDHPRIIWREFDEIPGAQEFIDEAAKFAPARGVFRTGYDYNYDVHKFCRKVFAQYDAAQEPCDTLVWLDSDVEATRDFAGFTEYLNGMPIALYERPGFHCESGIVIFDMAQCKALFDNYMGLYLTRKVYTLFRGWHDCWALDAVIAHLGLPTTNLSPQGRTFTNTANLEVVSASVLGPYFFHDKGPIKHAA